ncbi:MAG: cytochrome c biogenesis protein CcsA [Gammaproteobacteria bacterium]
MVNVFIGGLTAFLYLLAGVLLTLRLVQVDSVRQWQKSRLLWLAGIAVVLHGWLLARTVLLPAGVDLGFFNALSFTGWLSAAVLLLASVVRPVENLGIILLPFSAVSVVLAQLFPIQRLVSSTEQWPLEVHIIISILAYSLLALATLQALLLALQNRRLRQRNPGGFVRSLPPLSTMESLLFQLITIGFVLLSIALLSGFLFLEDIFAQHLVHKTILSIIAWLLFGILLWGHRRYGWRGPIAVRWTLGGFIVLMLAYFGSKLVLELILQR